MTNAASARWIPSPRILALSTVGWGQTTGGCNYSGWLGGWVHDEHSISQVEPITKNIGIVYSGMGPDYRWE